MIGPLVAFDRLPVVLVIVGGCIALVSFLGCCGACEDSVCFLCVVRIQSFLSPTHSLTHSSAPPLSLSLRGSSRSKYLEGLLTNGHTGHVPRAPGFFLFEGPPIGCGEIIFLN